MDVVIAGDYCPQHRVATLFEGGEYDAVLGEIKQIISGVDYSIVNFECPIINGNEKPIVKSGPNLGCSKSGMSALKWVGFNGVTLANNHFFDYGEEGVKNTIHACREYSMDYVGGGVNLDEASKVLYKTIGDKILAIINCCEHEFSIASDTQGGSNPLNPIQQFYTIKEARKKADFVIIIVHGGHEFFQFPSPRMIETYRFFVNCGADTVINHHQHCFSGYEVYMGKPIFYGIGNFCFDEKGYTDGPWNEGYFVKLSYNESISFTLYPYKQCDKEAKIVLLPPNAYERKLESINKIICNKKILEKEVKDYYNSCIKRNSYIFEPFMSRLYTSLRYRGLAPSLVSNRRKILATDIIGCESHRDCVMTFLSSYKKS